jgi:hypothetical protein
MISKSKEKIKAGKKTEPLKSKEALQLDGRITDWTDALARRSIVHICLIEEGLWI